MGVIWDDQPNQWHMTGYAALTYLNWWLRAKLPGAPRSLVEHLAYRLAHISLDAAGVPDRPSPRDVIAYWQWVQALTVEQVLELLPRMYRPSGKPFQRVRGLLKPD